MAVRPYVGAALVGLFAAAAALTPTGPASADETLTGRLSVVHMDDFRHGHALHEYALIGADGRSTELRFSDEGPHGLGGQRVRVHGQRHGSAVDVAAASDVQQAPATQPSTAAAAPAPGETKLAVVLLQFSDKQLNLSTTEVAPLISSSDSTNTSALTVQSFYSDNSLTNLSINTSAGDVFGVVTISAKSTDACAYRAWGDEARSKLAATVGSGFDDAAYTQVAHIMPLNTCTFSGISELPGKYTWDITDGVAPGNASSARRLRGLIEHELGHNLNAYHGASLACTDNHGTPQVLGSRCTKSEYGDPFTVMGYSRGERTFNAFQKGRVSWYALQQGRKAWLDSTRTTTVTSTSSVPLYPVDSATAPGPQVVRVAKPGSRTGEYYYVELRSGSGFDSQHDPVDPTIETQTPTNGVTIRIAPDYATGVATQLLDMTPNTAGVFTDAQLTTARAFTDGAGVTIALVSSPLNADDPATIRVTMTAPTRGK